MGHIGYESMRSHTAMIFLFGDSDRLFPGKYVVKDQIALMDSINTLISDLLSCKNRFLKSVSPGMPGQILKVTFCKSFHIVTV